MATCALTYTGVPLDRVSAQRQDAVWVEQRLRDAEARVVPVWRDRNAVTGWPDRPAALVLRRQVADVFLSAAAEVALLGLERGHGVLAVDLSPLDEATVQSLIGDARFVDLRQVGPLLDPPQAALLAFARGMLYWHRQHRFCGQCGHPTASRHGGALRVCRADECGRASFPRTDPAVIALVEHRPAGGPARCLLARSPSWPAGTYSTLAGFVEPGESLEEAVAREIEEEAGVRVEDVRYLASQPWPFPSSLMLGFRATAPSTELQIDPGELADARWFTAEELRTFGEWGDESAALRKPRRDSIARLLIEGWAAEQEAGF